jgi:hypothetical protein
MRDFLDMAENVMNLDRIGDSRKEFELVFKGIAMLQQVFAKSSLDLDNIESVFAAFEMATLLGRLGDLSPAEVSELNGSMRTLIFKTLEQSVDFILQPTSHINPPEPYGDFATLIDHMQAKPASSVSLATFNYDIALDFALYHENVPYTYCLGSRNSWVPLLKLHGSINWVRCKDCGQIVPWDLRSYFSTHSVRNRTSEPTMTRIPIATQLHEWQPEHSCGQGNETHLESEPLIVPPTWNKTEYHRDLQEVWRYASQDLSEAENIIVIGYSLPETDMFFRYLYALGSVGTTRLKRFWVFDPDETGAVSKRFQDMLGPLALARFQWRQMGFADAIDFIRKELDIS